MDREALKEYLRPCQDQWEDLDSVVDAVGQIVFAPTDKDVLRRMSTLSRMAGNIACGLVSAGLDADAVARTSLAIAELIVEKIEVKYR